MYRIVDRKVNGMIVPELSVSGEIHAFARPLIPIARKIVVELQRAAGVDDVAYGAWLGRARGPGKLVEALRPDVPDGAWSGHKLIYLKAYLWHDIAHAMEPYVGDCGDVPSGRVLRLVDQMRNVDVPYRCVRHWGWAEPATWQVPHVWPGFYLDEPLGLAHYRLDPVSGIGSGRQYIWRTAPLAPYALERWCIPLDAWIKQTIGAIGSIVYRRIAGNMYFMVPADIVDSVMQAIRKVLDPLPIDYYRPSVTDQPPGRELPVA